MDFSFKFLPIAEENIEDAIDYYATISLTVLKNFNKQLDFSISRIVTNPYFQKRFKNVRALPIKKFPYIIFYEVNEEEKMIYILSVFCTHQNPEKYP
ncbi:type II toxin-antitoxin system RelE/ParE family toxin [Chryseobacterium sp. Ch-15]|uniref:Type II toxin-antitoxin system RelE/ParE family toxin n=1 Tax=Chryseobacterium muglaense TaxID=2893752 RepID=A0A9Q3UWR9_9FLAO|nr:type II toxin-antitoxin system RelE/ParE family toxin [Chryseobacterium muglaense]MBD3904266.1 type II toxin-antitoxin system RelE/ParE family toxin [Chryseobacterium muglaense]MCC9035418.1 type II toxin-antitoxin system RelE/ParE family toxin [Chryseobacterium muglaense]MCM2553917.1 type II toxin-antitoxin system RelE/ParE family toxin [Chryseobacterium muglaense]